MRVYTDAARDDDIAGMGWVIILSSNDRIENSRYIEGNYTSMEAEYFALLDGVRNAKEYEDTIDLYCDCEPLIHKMNVPDNENEEWYERRTGYLRLMTKFDEWDLSWTPRGHNVNADRLAYEALEEGRNV